MKVPHATMVAWGTLSRETLILFSCNTNGGGRSISLRHGQDLDDIAEFLAVIQASFRKELRVLGHVKNVSGVEEILCRQGGTQVLKIRKGVVAARLDQLQMIRAIGAVGVPLIDMRLKFLACGTP